MEEQKCFEFVLSHLYDTISGLNAKMDTWKGLGVRTSHGGVVGSPMMFAKTDQNRPSWTKTVTIAWPSKSILNLSWIIDMTLPWTLCATPRPLYDCFWLLSLFKFPFNPEIQKFKILLLCYASDYFGSWWSILVHFGAYHGWPHHPSMTGSDSYPLSKAHLIQKWVILVTHDKFETLLFRYAILTIWINFGPIWSILVHLMGDTTTPTWLVLIPIPFQVSI